MIKLLWMLYLATTLYITLTLILINIDYYKLNPVDRLIADRNITFKMLSCCLLWSVWYFYYLN